MKIYTAGFSLTNDSLFRWDKEKKLRQLIIAEFFNSK